MQFEIRGEIKDIETIARGRGVYIGRHLERTYGKGRWRKMKGRQRYILKMVQYVMPKYTGSKRMVSAERTTK